MSNEIPDRTSELPHSPAPKTWRLRFSFRDKTRIRVLRRGERLLVGTSDAADLSLDDPTVSGRHCELFVADRGLEVKDLGSKNGIYLGAGRVDRALLTGPSASFSIGATRVRAEDRCHPADAPLSGLIGTSAPMQQVRAAIERLARLSAPVLIVGESGTGKDVVARALHERSQRGGRYLPLNVAALPDSLLDAELFGHERGAFTGAVGPRAGLFEMASGGTLFLDEIADMSPAGQAKLLRVVEDGTVRCLGSEREKRVDTRLVSATCQPLAARIEHGLFREDLYHRLAPLVIELPPLNRRRSDIPLLATHYLTRISSEMGHKDLLPESLELLRSSSWPGNVRQLFGVLYRAAALSTGDTIAPGDLSVMTVAKARPRLNAEHAKRLLDVHGTVSSAARAAGVPRTTFRSVLERAKLRSLR